MVILRVLRDIQFSHKDLQVRFENSLVVGVLAVSTLEFWFSAVAELVKALVQHCSVRRVWYPVDAWNMKHDRSASNVSEIWMTILQHCFPVQNVSHIPEFSSKSQASYLGLLICVIRKRRCLYQHQRLSVSIRILASSPRRLVCLLRLRFRLPSDALSLRLLCALV